MKHLSPSCWIFFSNKSFLCWVKVPAPSCNLSLTDNQRHLSYVTWILASQHSDVNNTQDNFFVERKKTRIYWEWCDFRCGIYAMCCGRCWKGSFGRPCIWPGQGGTFGGRTWQGDLAHLLSCQLHPSVYNTLATQFITSLLQSACVLCRRWHEWLWSASCQRRWQSSLKLRPWNESQCLSVRTSALFCAMCIALISLSKQSSRASV